MKITVKEISANEREMTFEHAWEDIEQDYNAFAKDFAKKVELTGFRKGKVPMAIIEKKFGPRIDYDFVNEKFTDYYGKALDEKKLVPVNQPELSDLDFKKNNPLKLTVKFEVMPEWDMPKYKNGFPIEENHYIIESGDIEESLLHMRENAAEVKPVEDAAKAGYHIIADVQELAKDKTVLNESKGSRIILGKAPFDEEAEKALIGVMAGETRTITLKAENKKDDDHIFKLDVTAVEEHILPELNDEFAQTVNPDGENLDALKEKTRKELENHWTNQSVQRTEEQIADFFINCLSDIELPKSVVEEYAKNIYEDMKKRYPADPEMDEAAVIENYRETAEKSLKWQLVKNKIIKEDEISISEEDIDTKIADMLKDVNEDLRESYEKYYQSSQIRNQLHDDMINTKLTDHIKSFAKIKTKKVARKARLKEMGQ